MVAVAYHWAVVHGIQSLEWLVSHATRGGVSLVRGLSRLSGSCGVPLGGGSWHPES